MVRHALQDVMPTLSATQTITANSKMYFFILFRFLVDKIDDLLLPEGAHKDAPRAVLRLCAGMNAYSGTSGYVCHQRQYLLKLRRHRIHELIRALWYDIIRVLKGCTHDFVCAYRYRSGASYGLAVSTGSR